MPRSLTDEAACSNRNAMDREFRGTVRPAQV